MESGLEPSFMTASKLCVLACGSWNAVFSYRTSLVWKDLVPGIGLLEPYTVWWSIWEHRQRNDGSAILEWLLACMFIANLESFLLWKPIWQSHGFSVSTITIRSPYLYHYDDIGKKIFCSYKSLRTLRSSSLSSSALKASHRCNGFDCSGLPPTLRLASS
jgi:hypothetical protein